MVIIFKDLKLAQNAVQNADTATPLDVEATALNSRINAVGESGRDFSGIINMIRGGASG